MAEKNNAVCSICGKEYYLCMSCRDSIKVNPWKMHCDTAPHYQVYQVIHGYNTNVYTKDEARTKLKNINLDDVESFRPHIKEIIKDILKENKPIVTIVDEVKNKTVVEKKTKSRKRNYKVNNEVEKPD